MNTCGACAHHRMTGPLAAHGFGTCDARPQANRAGISTPAQSTCRIGRFEAKKVVDLPTLRENDPQNRDQAKDYATAP